MSKLDNVYYIKTLLTNKSGTPDVLACIGGRFCAFEIKREGESASALQSVTLQEVARAGGLAFVLSGNDEVDQCLKQLKKLKRRAKQKDIEVSGAVTQAATISFDL